MNIEHDYLRLLKDVLDNGKEKEDRTGTGTISVFGRQIRHKMNQGYPLLTTKKMYWKGIVLELIWFLRGDTNIKYLVDNDCHIWDGDCYKKYCESHTIPPSNPGGPLVSDNLISVKPIEHSKEEFINKIKTDDEFAKKWGDLGPVYGKQWRDWSGDKFVGDNFPNFKNGIDQIQNSINLLKTDPDSRRNIVSAWSVAELDQMTLPPCHNFFQVYTRELTLEERREEFCHRLGKDISYSKNLEHDFLDKDDVPRRKISLMWNQRSVDTFLGLPFNIASYGLLLEIIAKGVNMVPDELIGNLGDVHLYKNHLEQAREQITRAPFELSRLVINDEFWNPNTSFLDQIEHIQSDDFYVKNYKSHPPIKALLSN